MWITSHIDLEGHPKTIDLAYMMGWNIRETVGALHCLWYWAVKYSEDGDLTKFRPAQIAGAMKESPATAEKLFAALIASRWIDEIPHLRLHDWYSHIGPWLRSRYKRTPERWEKIRDGYVTVTVPATSPPNKTRQDKIEGITTAPAAVDQSIRSLSDKAVAKMDAARLGDLRLPFTFGQEPDAFRKGFPIRELPIDTARAILARMPRLGGDVAKALRLRIAAKLGEMTDAQRRA